VSPYKTTVLRTGSRGAAVRALQRALGMTTVDGYYGTDTAGTVAKFQAARKLRKTGVVDRATWNQVEQVAHPLVRYRSTALRTGSRGTAVQALQRALRLTADGAYGARTSAAVRTVQSRAHLATTGTVDARTWAAVEQQAYPLGVRRW
jgi:peptidoglycan hydrolase-like protein with peptidoglycan-binding domain